MAIEIPELETLNLSDGTSVTLSKTPGLSAAEWAETKKGLEDNPEEARRMEAFSKDAKVVKNWMSTQAVYEFYSMKLASGDEAATNKLLGLEKNPEFAHIFEDVKRGGMAAAQQHSYNEALMQKVSRAVGGIPEDVKEALQKIHANPVTLQEACAKGNTKAVEESLKKTVDLSSTDSKGVTCLGYAVGANRTAIVKMLLNAKADPVKCDSMGGTALHYAAAYGRKELAEFFLGGGIDMNAKNTQGQTALALASRNKQKDTIDLLKSKGAQ